MSGTLDWDYSLLAEHYRHRAPYVAAALDRLFDALALAEGARVADIGAGTGALTRELVARRLATTAVEPNDAMRSIGMSLVSAARWIDARGEATGLAAAEFDLVAYGSSFNVLARDAALTEAARLLRDGGSIACLWNHRALDDPLQARVQDAIERIVPGYAHGSRREDPTSLIMGSGLFDDAFSIVESGMHACDAEHFVTGFRAHATLIRQAGAALPRVLDAIRSALDGRASIEVPMTTRIHVARRKPRT